MKNLFYTWTAILIVLLAMSVVFFSKLEKVSLFGVDIFTITRTDSLSITKDRHY